jgi:hypothetical protein
VKSFGYFSLIALSVSFFANLGFAALPSDFYCNETILSQAPGPDGQMLPVVASYSMNVKSCDGKSTSQADICSMAVRCVMIPDAVKTKAQATYNQEFSKLTEPQKANLMKYEFETNSVPSVLSCAGVANATTGVVSCPIPEKCKGDVLYKISTASIDSTDGPGNLDRVRSGTTHSFQTNTDDAPATSAGSASGSTPGPPQ